jgi:predicted O-methyltransferase YrrM
MIMRCTILQFAALSFLGVFVTALHAQRPGGQGGPPRQGPGRGNPLLRLFDTDGDGVLSQEEIGNAAAKLKELDTSKDGKISEEEMRRIMPFGPPRGGLRGGGRPFGRGGRGPGGGRVAEGDFDAPPLAKSDVEEKILAALEEMRQGPRYANVSPTDGRLLRLLTETIGAQNVVEIGTSTGESAVWFALGLRSTGGHLYTHEIDEERAEIAQENFKKAGVDDLITLILGDAHETVKQHKDPIDILFLDADKEGYIDYLNKLVPLIRPGGLIVAHNMNTRQADPTFLKAITTNPDFETLFLLKEGTGVGVTMKKR